MTNLETQKDTITVEERPKNTEEMTKAKFEESMELTKINELRQNLENMNKAAMNLVGNVSRSILERTTRGFIIGSLFAGIKESTREKVREARKSFNEKEELLEAHMEELKKGIEKKENIDLQKLFKKLNEELRYYLGELKTFFQENYSEEIKTASTAENFGDTKPKSSGINKDEVKSYKKIKDAKEIIERMERIVGEGIKSTEEIASQIASELKS